MGKNSNKKSNTFAAGIALIAAAVVILGCGIFWIIIIRMVSKRGHAVLKHGIATVV